MPSAERARYDAQRDPFARTGSPALPDGLNLGAQLHLMETLAPGLLGDGATMLPWAQYWAWRLSGVAASEVTTLGCHSDLWNPSTAALRTSRLRRGWAVSLPPLRRADECLAH
jgi:sugar (pentulose or hexulose) kinase